MSDVSHSPPRARPPRGSPDAALAPGALCGGEPAVEDLSPSLFLCCSSFQTNKAVSHPIFTKGQLLDHYLCTWRRFQDCCKLLDRQGEAVVRAQEPSWAPRAVQTPRPFPPSAAHRGCALLLRPAVSPSPSPTGEEWLSPLRTLWTRSKRKRRSTWRKGPAEGWHEARGQVPTPGLRLPRASTRSSHRGRTAGHLRGLPLT